MSNIVKATDPAMRLSEFVGFRKLIKFPFFKRINNNFLFSRLIALDFAQSNILSFL